MMMVQCQIKTRRSLFVGFVPACTVLLVGMLTGCKGQVRTKTATVPGPEGENVRISGPVREVQTIQREISELRSFAVDARKWFELYKESKHDLESAVADKELRDLRKACGDILAICEKVRRQPELMRVNGAGPILDEYSEFARKMLADVGGR